MRSGKERLAELLGRVRACRLCEPHLPHGPRPVLQVDASARILIAGQAPGLSVHLSGKPFDDRSGDRLRQWMGIDSDTFYDPRIVAILPMGFCYPGAGTSGDLPPRPECAPTWRALLLEQLRFVELTLVVGRYAANFHLQSRHSTLTEIVKGWREHGPNLIALPHPSPRNRHWLRRNPWFEQELVPYLRTRVAAVLEE